MRTTVRIWTALNIPLIAFTASTARAQTIAATKPDLPGMGMSSSVDLNDPMSQEASGTAWIPASTPIYARMWMKHGDMYMAHGAIMPRYTDVALGSPRGDRRLDAPNWFMGMYTHRIDPESQLGLRAMFSLDPITEGGWGYPLLYQTGETWHDEPLHDRQHPHNFQDELAATYSHLIGGGRSLYLYVADPGEPALGPPTYMHRLLASDYPDAPIGHHWQDATHITFGVATAGLNLNSKVKIEASSFTGREPDEDRWSFNKPRFDSQSGRISWSPDDDNALQVSYGLQRDPEGNGIDVHRTTASWLYNVPLTGDRNFTTALVWGQNDASMGGRTNSYLAEADYQLGRNTYFFRIENIQKSGEELVLPEPDLQQRNFDLGAYTVGCVHDIVHGKGIDTGIGLAVTVDEHPAALNADYGAGMPLGFEVYLRFRPSRMKGMAGMDVQGPSESTIEPAQPAPAASPVPPSAGSAEPSPSSVGLPASAPAQIAPSVPATTVPPVVGPVLASIAPDPPVAGRPNALTLSISGSDGKPLSGASIKASVAMTSMDMGTSHPGFQDLGDGSYRAAVTFSMAGPWKVTVNITPPNGGSASTRSFAYTAH